MNSTFPCCAVFGVTGCAGVPVRHFPAASQRTFECSLCRCILASWQDYRVDAGEFTIVGMRPFSQDCSAR